MAAETALGLRRRLVPALVASRGNLGRADQEKLDYIRRVAGVRQPPRWVTTELREMLRQIDRLDYPEIDIESCCWAIRGLVHHHVGQSDQFNFLAAVAEGLACVKQRQAGLLSGAHTIRDLLEDSR